MTDPTFPPHVRPHGDAHVRITGRASCGHRVSAVVSEGDWEEKELEVLLRLREGPCEYCLMKGFNKP